MNNRSSTTPQSDSIYDFETLEEKWKHDFQTHFNVTSMSKNEPKLVSSTSKKIFLRPRKKIVHVSNVSKWNRKDPPQTIIEIEETPGVHRTSKVQKLHFRVIPNTHPNSHQNLYHFPYTKSHTICLISISLSTDLDLWII